MKKEVSQNEFRKYYLSEFELYDGEAFITFNIVSINTEKREIVVAVTDRGKISVITYDLLTDKNGDMYFEYGCMLEKVNIDDFEEAYGGLALALLEVGAFKKQGLPILKKQQKDMLPT